MKRLYLLVAAISVSAPAYAGTMLNYVAPPDCPSEARFVDAVAARGADFGGADSSKTSRALLVTIRKDSNSFHGAFQIRDDAGISGTRYVTGDTCAEVSDALAVVTAIALRTAFSDAEPSAPAARPVAPAPDPAAVPPGPAEAHERLRARTRLFPSRTETLRVPAGDLRLDLARTAGLGFGATWGLTPMALLRYEVAFTTANFVTAPDNTQRIAGLVYQLKVAYLGSGRYLTPDSQTDVAGAVFGISMCQSPLYDSQGFSMLVCLGYGGGFFNFATTRSSDRSTTNTVEGFGTLDGTADLTYNVTPHILFSGRLGGSFEIGDITGADANGRVIFKSSHWSANATLGIGLRF